MALKDRIEGLWSAAQSARNAYSAGDEDGAIRAAGPVVEALGAADHRVRRLAHSICKSFLKLPDSP